MILGCGEILNPKENACSYLYMVQRIDNLAEGQSGRELCLPEGDGGRIAIVDQSRYTTCNVRYQMLGGMV